MDTITTLYLIGMVGLIVGGGIWIRLVTDSSIDNSRGKFGYLLIVPGFAAVAYAIMASGVTTVTIGGTTVFPMRYVDWLVTTPVLVGYVAYVAGAPRKWIIGIALADALMIIFGMVAVAVSGTAMWAAFAASSIFHLSLLYILYRVLPRYVDPGSGRRRLFKILQNHIGLLWLAYPFVWLASPAGLGYVSVLGTAMVITYLDVIAKTPYVYFIWREREAFAEEQSGSSGTTEPVQAPTVAGSQ